MADSRTEIGDLWRKVNREMHDLFRGVFRDSEMHIGHMFMLRQIQAQPGVTISELARRAGTVKSHVSRVIDSLCQQGYLEKRPDPADQRLLHVFTTPLGQELAAEMEAKVASAWSRVIDRVPETKQAEVARGLDILLTALTESNSTLSDRR